MKLTAEATSKLERASAAYGRSRNVRFECRPRYCCGSPALVPEDTCAKEAIDEFDAYHRDLTGFHGEERKARAEKLGLRGICFARWEVRGKTWRHDLITGETMKEPPRMSYDDKERLRVLRNMKAYGVCRWSNELAAELAVLEDQAECWRETI